MTIKPRTSIQSKNSFTENFLTTFLEMAAGLESKGYKDAAVVITGSVLEEHVRKLATRNWIALQGANGRYKSLDSLAIDLVKLQQISESLRKMLVA